MNPLIQLRGAFYLLVLVAVSAIPFALAQRNAMKRSMAVLGNYAMPAYPDLSPWTIVASYPVMVEASAVASDGIFGYSAGGRVSGAGSNGLYKYDRAANTWTPLANVPTAFYDAPAVFATNTNSIYVFGGYNGTVLNTTQIYNIGTGTWSMGAAMPAGRFFASAAYHATNGKIYVIGGFDPTFAEANQTWEYDPVANTWNTSRANIPVAMAGAGYSIVGQYIYLAGHWMGGAASTDHYRYDIVGNTWAAMAPVPVPIYGAASATVGTNTYLVGGGNPSFSGGNPTTSYNSTYIYDTASNSWTTGPTTNVPHAFTGGTAIGTHLLVVAGFNGTSDTNVVETADAGGGARPTPTPRPRPTPAPRP